jgi:hypothetical protein
VNLGTDNKKKTIAAVVLIGLALVMLVYRVMFPAGAPPAATVAPPSTISSTPATPSSPRSTPRRTSSGKKQPMVASLDPTLRLWLLQSSENTAYTGNARNIFRAQAEPVIPKPISTGIKQPPTPPPVYTPPPPPPINLKFFGFASKPGEPKKVFLSQGEDVFIAGEGDIVDRRYKIVRITPMSVEVEDVLNNNRQSIPLTQG